MNFEDSQDYIQKRGLDVPWNDCDVFIDERAITRTVGNVLLWADEHPIHNTDVDLDKESMNYLLNEHKSPLNDIMHQVDLKTEMQYYKDIQDAFKAGFIKAVEG